MFERQEIAPVLFFIGLGLLIMGVLGASVWVVSNIVAGILGTVLMVAGIVWWQLLKRR